MNFKSSIENAKILKDLTVIRPDLFEEQRGAIWTSYHRQAYDNLIPIDFVHDKFSTSQKNVLRGIHGDNKSWKLISCPFGDIFAVVVDMRQDSDTYLTFESFRLNRENNMQIIVPPGFGNSFCVLSEVAVYHYKLAYEGHYLDADEQFTVAWDDPKIGIDWPINDPILSDRDARLKWK